MISSELALAAWLRAVARVKALGALWMVSLVAVAGLMAQQIGGWPARTKWQVQRPNPQAIEVFQFPKNLAPEKWNRGLIRVTRGGHTLPRFANEEAFNAATIEGYFFRGKNVVVRAPTGEQRHGEPVVWSILVPWCLGAAAVWTILAAEVLLTAFLVGFRNPVVIALIDRTWGWWRGPGLPWPALVFAALVFAAAVLLRVYGFSYPSWENDSPSYFSSVFHVVDGGLPLATPDRPFAYPLVVGTLLRGVPDLRAILTLHMFGSLVAACLIGAVVWLAGERLFASPVGRSSSRFLGTAVFAAFALNEAILEREWALLSEAWAAFYMGPQVWLAWLLTRRKSPLSTALWLFAGFCLSGLLTFFTRSNWGFALGLLPLPWMVACLINADSRSSFFGWAAAGAGVLLALTAATFTFQAFCKPDTASPYLYDRARALVCWHVPLIEAEIDRRRREQPQDPSGAVLAEISQVLRDEVENAKTRGSGSYPSLAFDPDFLYFHGLAAGPNFRALSMEERTQLCMDLFKGGLRHFPSLYFGKVLAQMRLFFVAPYQKPNIYLPDVAKQLARSEKAIAGHEMPPRFAATYATVIAAAKEELGRPWPSAARLALSEREVLIFGWLTNSFTWCLVVPGILCAMSVAWPKWRNSVEWRDLAPALTVASWSFGSACLSALSSAATQGLDIQRYIQLSMPVTLLAHALFPMLAMSLLLALPRRGAVTEAASPQS